MQFFLSLIKQFADNIDEFLEQIPKEDKLLMTMFSGEAVFLFIVALLEISEIIVLGVFIGSLIALSLACRIWLQDQQKQRDTPTNSIQKH
jgi:hypothetical protein